MSRHDFEAMRRAMVSNQLRTTAVSDRRVVSAMESVAREDFVPAERQALAYVDASVPLGNGRALNLPMVTARLLNESQVESRDSVLIVGSATGYSAAVVARIAGRVVALESDPALAATARSALAGVEGVTCVEGPLEAGYKKGGPYDLILIDGAIEVIPDALVAQLSEGGRIAAALVDSGVTRLVIARKAGGSCIPMPFAEADAVPLPGFARAVSFSF